MTGDQARASYDVDTLQYDDTCVHHVLPPNVFIASSMITRLNLCKAKESGAILAAERKSLFNEKSYCIWLIYTGNNQHNIFWNRPYGYWTREERILGWIRERFLK